MAGWRSKEGKNDRFKQLLEIFEHGFSWFFLTFRVFRDFSCFVTIFPFFLVFFPGFFPG